MTLLPLVVLALGLLAVAVIGPLTRVALVASARRAGVNLADAETTARLARTDMLVLDGIAGLTDGKTIISTDPVEPDHLRNLRWFAGALERHSDHPIGRAIGRLAPRGRVSGVEHHPGRGISGSVDQHPVRVGSPEWIGVPVGTVAPSNGGSVTIAVEVDARLLGTFTLVDRVRDDAADCIASLRDLGVEVVIASETDYDRAESVADQVGVDRLEKSSVDSVVEAAVSASAQPAPLPGEVPLDAADIAQALDALHRARRFAPTTWIARGAAAAVTVIATLVAFVVT